MPDVSIESASPRLRPDDAPEPFLALRRRRVLIALGAIAAALVALHIVSRLVRFELEVSPYLADVLLRLDLDVEVSIPTWWSQTQLLIAAALLAYIARWSTRRRYWIALSAIFVVMSLDEGSSLHELLAAGDVREALGIPDSGPLALTWYVPIGVVVLVLVAVFLRFYLRLPGATRLGLAVAAVLFVGGSVGVEMISSDFLTNDDHSPHSRTYTALTAAEEGLEILGVTALIWTLLGHIRDHLPVESRRILEVR